MEVALEVISRGWNKLKEQARKILDFHEGNIKDNAGEGSEEGIKYREYLIFLWNYLSIQNGSRNMDKKGHLHEVAELRNKALETEKKGPLCCIVARNLESCSCPSGRQN